MKLEDGKVAMRINLGPWSATCPLPEEMAGYNEEQLQGFFAQVVPGMTEHLIQLRNDEQRKNRKAARAALTANKDDRKKLKLNPEDRHLRPAE